MQILHLEGKCGWAPLYRGWKGLHEGLSSKVDKWMQVSRMLWEITKGSVWVCKQEKIGQVVDVFCV